MRVILNLTGPEVAELVSATSGTTFAKQVKMAALKAETKALEQAIALTEAVESEIATVEAVLTK